MYVNKWKSHCAEQSRRPIKSTMTSRKSAHKYMNLFIYANMIKAKIFKMSFILSNGVTKLIIHQSNVFQVKATQML